MEKYISFVQEFHESNPIELDFINNHLKSHLKDKIENQDDIEKILDYLYSEKPNISKIGYKTILEKTEKWHKKLQSVKTKDTEIEGIDYDVVLDFKDGFRFVQLKSKECYQREGKLMSHCVASYYGRNAKIYSLRDSKNKPHCTIEDGQQIKGKGNGKIDPNYVDYVVKFLQYLGMTVGENEMKNLGYYKLETIDKDLTCEKMYNGYVYENNLSEIKDSEGRTYKGVGLWNIRPVCDIRDDGKFRLYEDIQAFVEYEKIINKCTDTNRDSTRNASSGDHTRNASSGDSTQNASSGDSTQNASSAGYTQNASSGDYTQNASSGDHTRNASSGHSTRNASSGDHTRNASSGDHTRNASSGDHTRNASSGHSTRSEINGKYGITADIGINSKSKGIIGTWIVLAEYDKNTEGYWYPKHVKCGQIDGKILKEDTWYMLKNWEFTETE